MNRSVASSQQKLFGCSLLSSAYFPPVEYFAAIANSERVLVEKCEIFQKQSYRTRCHIYGANGLLSLSLPVLRGEGHTHKLLIDSIKIDYSKPWVQQHSRAMDAAYMTTPFYEYYRDDIMAILESGEDNLFNLNYRLLELFCELIGLSTEISFTKEWVPVEVCSEDEIQSRCELADFRGVIHPKFKGKNLLQSMNIEKPYYQVFSSKGGFIGNLSILDLLCNEGPNSINFLK